MLKAIYARDVRKGDVVRTAVRWYGVYVTMTVEQVLPCRHGALTIQLLSPERTGKEDFFQEDDVLILLRRPWPEGKTVGEMFAEVEKALRRCVQAELENDGRGFGTYVILSKYNGGMDDALRSLREAIEAYELGKPLEVKS